MKWGLLSWQKYVGYTDLWYQLMVDQNPAKEAGFTSTFKLVPENCVSYSRLQQNNVSTTKVFVRCKTDLYLTKTFVVEMLYNTN